MMMKWQDHFCVQTIGDCDCGIVHLNFMCSHHLPPILRCTVGPFPSLPPHLSSKFERIWRSCRRTQTRPLSLSFLLRMSKGPRINPHSSSLMLWRYVVMLCLVVGVPDDVWTRLACSIIICICCILCIDW